MDCLYRTITNCVLEVGLVICNEPIEQVDMNLIMLMKWQLDCDHRSLLNYLAKVYIIGKGWD